ncbi:amidohydrolase [Halobacillus karajensis]|uniref:M20 metallopeptidase family protein n=1 Tax=Halobacillus karajensis TaxID=195088 RepID=UPI0008A77BC7|nr:M20 family metallopeptidase [Halobacillus karajensis]SEH48984.1 amidohydrolase [Halobacillus karajensis]
MKTKKADLVLRSNQLFDLLVKWRRDFHRYPELSFKEKRTSETVIGILEDLEVFQIEKNVGGYGVIATVTQGEGPVVGIRADMDALPIFETTESPWSSRVPGVMHACGHDAHTAILLGVAHLLAEDVKAGRFQGTIMLIFQPAEESCDEWGETGALKMLRSGKLDKLDVALALHMCPWRKTGEIQWHNGPSMANNDEFHLQIKGSGGHAGYPQHVKDPVWMATYVLQSLYSLNGRKVDPLDVGTISVGQIHAGEANNIIPDTVEVQGTIRSYKDEVRETLLKEIHQTAEIITALGGEYSLKVNRGEPSLINDPYVNNVIREASYGMTQYEAPFGMGSEDFSYFTRKVPGAMFFLGCGLDKETGLHQSDFNIDEKSLPHGVRVLLNSAYLLLERGGGFQ